MILGSCFKPRRKKHDATVETEKEVLIALAKNKITVSKVAKYMGYHRNTIMYHVEHIRNETGKDPLDFCDLTELLKCYGLSELLDQLTEG